MSARQRAKAEELGVGVRTVQRWLAAFQTEGPAGLLDGRHFRETDPLRGLDQALGRHLPGGARRARLRQPPGRRHTPDYLLLAGPGALAHALDRMRPLSPRAA